MLPLNACPALVLNADYQPLSAISHSPSGIGRRAIKAIFLDRVDVVSHYERFIHSPGFEMRLPCVVALKQYIPQDRRPPFTRFNVFLRDRFSCQYCQKPSRPTSSPSTICCRAPAAGGRPGPTSSPPAPAAICARPTGCRTIAACTRCPSPRAELAPAPARWPLVPAQLPAPELARLSLLGRRARSLRLAGCARRLPGTYDGHRCWRANSAVTACKVLDSLRLSMPTLGR